MAIRLVALAEDELNDAINYYEDQLTGLGLRFLKDIQETLDLLSFTPYGWRLASKRTRRINTKRFPYLILYVIDGDDIVVTCIAHQHRNPQYYCNRAD